MNTGRQDFASGYSTNWFRPRRALFPPRENFSRTWSVVVLVVQLELLLLFSVGECEHLATVETGLGTRRALFARVRISQSLGCCILSSPTRGSYYSASSVGECEQWGARPFQLATVETGLGTQRAKLKSFTELAIIVLAVGNDFIL